MTGSAEPGVRAVKATLSADAIPRVFATSAAYCPAAGPPALGGSGALTSPDRAMSATRGPDDDVCADKGRSTTADPR